MVLLFEVLDTAAGVWLDRNGLVTSSRPSRGHTDVDPSVELMRRGRHAAASVGVRVYIYGGLKGGKDTASVNAVHSLFHFTELPFLPCFLFELLENIMV